MAQQQNARVELCELRRLLIVRTGRKGDPGACNTPQNKSMHGEATALRRSEATAPRTVVAKLPDKIEGTGTSYSVVS